MKKVSKKYLLLSVLIIAIIAAGVFYYSNRETPASDAKTILEEWGNPESFVIFIDPENKIREEVWSYTAAGIDISFKNGKYSAVQESALAGKDLQSLYGPIDFANANTLEDVSKILKAEPKTSAQLDPELSNEARIYFYEGGIIVGADSDDKIVLIQY